MITFSQSMRLLTIQRVFLRHGLDEVLLDAPVLRSVRFLRHLFPWNWFRRKRAPRGVRIRRALEDLGPIFVKFGQMLSTRRDLFPPDIAAELARLQDKVPPFPGAEARAIVEHAYVDAFDQNFAEFLDEPLASASIAQVHAARLRDGREVVVKVLRPGVQRVIRRDLSLMYLLARAAERYLPGGSRLRPREVVAEYEQTILNELDLMREAANATQTRRNFDNNPILYVPYVVWELTTRNVMVMERIAGIPVSDVETLRRRGVNLRRLSERGVEIFFTQVFRHNFFHADMHPGNIFVSDANPNDPTYIAVDFGIVGTLSPRDQKYLAHNLLAFFNRDFRRVAELHVESGWVPANTRVDQFEAAVRTVCEPIFNRPLKDISFGQLLVRLFQTARQFDMQVQPQLVLLQKTLLNVEGLGRDLYPDLDLWQTAKPFMERWMREQLGVRSVVNRLRENLPAVVEALPDMPLQLYRALQQIEATEQRQKALDRQLESLRSELRRSGRRHFLGAVGAALVVGAIVLMGLTSYLPMSWGGAPLGTWILGLAGVAVLIGGWRD
ncbi:MAG TPA: ubiquinone biosynthesis regulatory protein kinase UbiB [Gammaproteobacteria bacterium]|nr:ubiquinone biosynthesis regulatory protein kinase UbiB [Gammaproteobacteria bacterium]